MKNNELLKDENNFKEERRIFFVGIISIATIVALLAVTIFMSMPSNVLSIRDGSLLRKTAVEFFPQGWAFFTKPPSDNEVVPYSLSDDDVLTNVASTPQSEAKNIYGLSRSQRAQGPEIAFLIDAAEEWEDCASDEIIDCAINMQNLQGPRKIIDNDFNVPNLCGTIVLVEVSPTRWSYRELETNTHSPVRGTIAEVKC